MILNHSRGERHLAGSGKRMLVAKMAVGSHRQRAAILVPKPFCDGGNINSRLDADGCKVVAQVVMRKTLHSEFIESSVHGVLRFIHPKHGRARRCLSPFLLYAGKKFHHCRNHRDSAELAVLSRLLGVADNADRLGFKVAVLPLDKTRLSGSHSRVGEKFHEVGGVSRKPARAPADRTDPFSELLATRQNVGEVFFARFHLLQIRGRIRSSRPSLDSNLKQPPEQAECAVESRWGHRCFVFAHPSLAIFRTHTPQFHREELRPALLERCDNLAVKRARRFLHDRIILDLSLAHIDRFSACDSIVELARLTGFLGILRVLEQFFEFHLGDTERARFESPPRLLAADRKPCIINAGRTSIEMSPLCGIPSLGAFDHGLRDAISPKGITVMYKRQLPNLYPCCNRLIVSQLAPVAQWLEQGTHNSLVIGSSPVGGTFLNWRGAPGRDRTRQGLL